MRSQYKVVKKNNLNDFGVLKGGKMLQWMDEFAERFSIIMMGTKVLTACIENVVFHKPTNVGEYIFFESDIITVGNTSMLIKIEGFRWNGSDKELLVSGFVKNISVDDAGKPLKVKGI